MNIISFKEKFVQQKKRVLISLILVFLITRVFLLFLGFDSLIWHEERYNGTITLEVMKGLKMPLFDYQHVTYTSGSVVMGILAVPLFKLFGESYLVYKVLPMLLSALILSLWYLLIFRYFGARTALLWSLFFIITPANNFIYSVFGAGHHYESILFSIVMISLFFPLVSDKRSEKAKGVYSFILGFVAGFGTYFVLTSLATVILILVFWYASDRKFMRKKNFLFFLIAFLIGISPWIYNTVAYGFSTLKFHRSDIFLPEQSESVIDKISRIITTIFPLSFGFLNIRDTIFNAYAYYLLAVWAYFYLIWKYRLNLRELFYRLFTLKNGGNMAGSITPVMFLLIFPLVYMAIYILSNFDVPHFVMTPAMLVNYDNNMTHFMQFRYFTPLFPFVFLFISMFLVDLMNSEKFGKIKKRISLILICSVLIFCSFDYLKLIYPPDFGKGLLYGGSDYMTVGRKLASHNHGNIEKTLEQVDKIGGQYRNVALRGVGVFYGFEKNLVFLPEFVKYTEERKESEKKQLYMGLSYGLIANNVRFDPGKIMFYRTNGKVFPVDEIIREINPEYLYFFEDSFGSKILPFIKFKDNEQIKKTVKMLVNITLPLSASLKSYRIPYDDEGLQFWIKRIEKFPTRFKGDFYRSLGRASVKDFFEDNRKYLDDAKKIPAQYRNKFFKGLSSATSPFFSKSPSDALSHVSAVDENYRKYFLYSLGKALFWKWNYDFGRINDIINSLKQSERKYCYGGVGSGAGFLLYWNPSKLKEIESKVPESYRVFFRNAADYRIDNDSYLSKQDFVTYFRDFNEDVIDGV